jgi:hypothetical protein
MLVNIMVSITLSIPVDLKKKMNRHPEIRWSEVVRAILQEQVDDLEEAEKLAAKSRLTEADVREFSRLVDGGVAKRWKDAFGS